MIKPMIAVVVAVLLAGAAVAIPGLATVKVEAHILPAKGDRLDIRSYGTACSERGWPHFETSCLRDDARPGRQARQVRIIPLDRLELSETR